MSSILKPIKNKKKGGAAGEEDFEIPHVAPVAAPAPPVAAPVEHHEATTGGARKNRASSAKKAAAKKATFKPKSKK